TGPAWTRLSASGARGERRDMPWISSTGCTGNRTRKSPKFDRFLGVLTSWRLGLDDAPKTGHHLQRRSMSGQSGPRRLRRRAEPWLATQGALRWLVLDDQQPDGDDGRDRGARGVEGALRRGRPQRLRVRRQFDPARLGGAVARARVAAGGQAARVERR